MTIKPFLNIHDALSLAADDIESTDLMKGFIAVALMSLSSAPFSSFTEAHQTATKYTTTVSQTDIPKVFLWIQARNKKPLWCDGSVMPRADVKAYLAPFPIWAQIS